MISQGNPREIASKKAAMVSRRPSTSLFCASSPIIGVRITCDSVSDAYFTPVAGSLRNLHSNHHQYNSLAVSSNLPSSSHELPICIVFSSSYHGSSSVAADVGVLRADPVR